MKTIGMHQFHSMKFDSMQFTGDWLRSLGKPVTGFSCIVYGPSGEGKTTFDLMFVKYLCKFINKIGYVSSEEGISGTMQEAFKRLNMMEVSGSVILIEGATFEDIVKYFSKRGSPDAMFLDSIDYLKLTVEQYKYLREKFPKKAIIMISWAEGNKPLTKAAREIEYMVDIKLRVRNYVVFPKSRFGGNQPFIIYEERARMFHPKLFTERDKINEQKPHLEPNKEDTDEDNSKIVAMKVGG